MPSAPATCSTYEQRLSLDEAIGPASNSSEEWAVPALKAIARRVHPAGDCQPFISGRQELKGTISFTQARLSARRLLVCELFTATPPIRGDGLHVGRCLQSVTVTSKSTARAGGPPVRDDSAF